MKFKNKLIILFFLILLSYFVYSLECTEVNDCDDNKFCTTDSCSSGNCSYINISGCVEENFILLGESFVMGEGTCKYTYKYTDTNMSGSTIILERDSEPVSLTFDNTTSNSYGYPIIYDFEISDKIVTFYLRHSTTRNLLYLEDINKSCPFSDLCQTNEDCDDNNPCTIDECDGTPLACVHHFIPYCKNNDYCCPSKCNETTDNDCVTDRCNLNSDCNDNNPCTNDLCNGTPKLCLNIAITECVGDDDCCPSDCIYNTDSDCEKPVVCGDSLCEGNETRDNCCKDCKCDEDYECIGDSCQKTKKSIAEEILEMNEDFKKKEEKLINEGFILKENLFLKTENGFDFNYIYKKGEEERIITGNVDDQNNIQSIDVKGEPSVFWYNVILVLVFLITVVGLSIYRNIRLKKEEEKEAYYSKLLRQKTRGPFHRR